MKLIQLFSHEDSLNLICTSYRVCLAIKKKNKKRNYVLPKKIYSMSQMKAIRTLTLSVILQDNLTGIEASRLVVSDFTEDLNGKISKIYIIIISVVN